MEVIFSDDSLDCDQTQTHQKLVKNPNDFKSIHILTKEITKLMLKGEYCLCVLQVVKMSTTTDN